MLRELYLQYMLEKTPAFYNPDYKTYKLKSKLMKTFGNDIHFWQPNYKSELIYTSGLAKGRAVESAFESAASDNKRMEEAALFLRRKIQEAHNKSDPLPWPPSASFLLGDTIKPPHHLHEFISHLISGKDD